MSGPKKKPALTSAMAAALGRATAQDVKGKSDKLAKKCKDLGVSHKAVVDIENNVALYNGNASTAMAELEQIAGLLEGISVAESQLPADKKSAADEKKRQLLKSYINSASWMEAAVVYHMILMNTAAEARVAATPAPATTPWTTGTVPDRPAPDRKLI